MLINVDLPAPFSPMIPWIVPGITEIEMSLLACTGPKALEMPLSSMAGDCPVIPHLIYQAGPRLCVGVAPSFNDRIDLKVDCRAGIVGVVRHNFQLAIDDLLTRCVYS